MAQFPTKEAAVSALAEEMMAGLAAHTTTFPVPPVSATDLEVLKTAYLTAHEAMTQAYARYERSVAAKDKAFRALVDSMKSDLRYAENTVHFEDGPLKLLGWGGRRPKRPLEAPGQCLTLEAPREGEDWIYLKWKQPIKGGAVAAYEIQRRDRSGGAWQEVGLSMEKEITLNNQPRGKEWEYRVLAVNKAGKGAPSNVVMAVL